MVVEYPRYLRPEHKPFDPLKLAARTEDIVYRDSKRKYTCKGIS